MSEIKVGLTIGQQDALEGLDELKRYYAWKVVDFLKTVPTEHQQIVYYQASNVMYEIADAIGKDAMKRAGKLGEIQLAEIELERKEPIYDKEGE